MMNRLILAGALALGLSGCQEAMRPSLSPVGSNLQPGAAPLVASAIALPPSVKPAAGSLWVPGSKQFFKDSRARVVGDIITVVVSEEATASSQAKTGSSRSHDQSAGILSLPFISGQLTTRGIDLAATGLADTTSNRNFSGDASTDRTDSLNANIAAVVKQVMPNGLRVIEGQREVMVNYEKQVLVLSGIVRPEDISSQNTIPSSKIAEARIAYSGRGIVDESQQPQYGVRLLDKILPF